MRLVCSNKNIILLWDALPMLMYLFHTKIFYVLHRNITPNCHQCKCNLNVFLFLICEHNMHFMQFIHCSFFSVSNLFVIAHLKQLMMSLDSWNWLYSLVNAKLLRLPHPLGWDISLVCFNVICVTAVLCVFVL